MGRKRYRRIDVSQDKTDLLGISSLLALKASTDTQYEAVHQRYFSDEKVPCPSCGSTKTRCSKVLRRTFKDILWDKTPGDEDAAPSFKVIDLIFYQRYLRCDACSASVFPEPIDFSAKGSRYTDRLSDALADGTFRFSYKRVCDYYGVPASTASIGPIMRRRIQYWESQRKPLSTPQILGIMEVTFYQSKYTLIFAVRDDGVYCMDILPDAEETTILTYLRTLDPAAVTTVYIDPTDAIRNAAAVAFPVADLVVPDESILRYARNAMLEIIHSDGKRFPIKHKGTALTMLQKHLQNDRDRKQIAEGMESRPRLKLAYDKHQKLMSIMQDNWDYKSLSDWSKALPDSLPEFDPLVDAIDFFEPEISCFKGIAKPPDFYVTAIQAICEAFKEMPHCIFDVLRARCFFDKPHDADSPSLYTTVGGNYRLGISTDRFVQNMREITENIKEDREYGLER